MKRFLVFLLSLFALTAAVSALPLFPQTKVMLPLSNGRSLELDFFGPKDAILFFDESILTDGFAQLSKAYKLNNDFSVSFIPQNTNELQFIVAFDSIPSDHNASLHPSTNAAGLRGLPLAVPRDALILVQSWYKSFLANPSPNKSVDFLSTMQRTTFIVDYSATAPITGKGAMLAMHGVFQNDTPVFGAKMELMDYSTFSAHHIDLFSADYLQTLQTEYFYVLDPIKDPVNPGLKRESVFVYFLFDTTAPK